MIWVLIADDQKLVRDGWCALLDHSSGVSVVGQARDGQEAVALAQQLQPDVILMDLKMPRLDGLQATRQIVERQPGAMILIVTQSVDEPLVRAALHEGAQGYLSKNDTFDELVPAILALQAKQHYFSKTIREEWPHIVSGHLARVGEAHVCRDSPWPYLIDDLQRARAETRDILIAAQAARQQCQTLRARLRRTRAFARQLYQLRHPDPPAAK